MGRYSNRFVLALLINGQVQKDLANGEVHIPFGSEYVVRCRNKNNRRAVVELRIDGELVGSFVVNANSHVDVKRWADKDVAFKFVDLESPEAYDHGKQGPNPDKTKGLIEARFRLEKEKGKVIHEYLPIFTTLPINSCNPHWHNPCEAESGSGIHPMQVIRCQDYTTSSRSYSSNKRRAYTDVKNSIDAVANVDIRTTPVQNATPIEEGCTVEGSQTGQKFYDVSVDVESTETVLSLFLKGYHPTDGYPAAPSLPKRETSLNQIQSAKFCTQCGAARMSPEAKFCGNCGNKL